MPSTTTAQTTELNNGMKLAQPEFHRLYRRTPPGFKAELVGGVVVVASPVNYRHGRPHQLLAGLLDRYEEATRGTQACTDTTVILGPSDEPQPDLFLRILPRFGGQTRIRRKLLVGAPELVVEIAHSSTGIDLGTKKDRYRAHGVREYLVADVAGGALHAFDFAEAAEFGCDPDGILRLRQFPGFWIHAAALFAGRTRQLRQTLLAGLASPEHAAFAAKLAAAKVGRPPAGG
jgi:Uma2 family endonuclease